MYNDDDRWSRMTQLKPEERALLKRASTVMGIPRKVVGQIGGCWYINADASKNRKGGMWDSWNPLKDEKQLLNMLVEHKVNVSFIESDGGVCADDYRVYVGRLQAPTLKDRVALAVTMAVALKCTATDEELADEKDGPTQISTTPVVQVETKKEEPPNGDDDNAHYCC